MDAWRLPVVVLAAVAIGGANAPGGIGEAPWPEVVRAHLASYPGMAAEDVYKLAHQAVFGPGHLIKDVESVRGYLDRELQSVEPGDEEPLMETLGGGLVRVNLRPFKGAGGGAEALLSALLATANSVKGDRGRMRAALDVAAATLEDLGRSADAARLCTLAAEMEQAGFPAIHHSTGYQQLYHPAYRVVLASLVPALQLTNVPRGGTGQ